MCARVDVEIVVAHGEVSECLDPASDLIVILVQEIRRKFAFS